MHGGMMAGMGWWMLLWGLAALMLLVLAVLGIAALVRHLSNRTRRATRRAAARRGLPAEPTGPYTAVAAARAACPRRAYPRYAPWRGGDQRNGRGRAATVSEDVPRQCVWYVSYGCGRPEASGVGGEAAKGWSRLRAGVRTTEEVIVSPTARRTAAVLVAVASLTFAAASPATADGRPFTTALTGAAE